MSDRTSTGTSSRRDDVWWYFRSLGCNPALARNLTNATFADETIQHTPESDITAGRSRRLRVKARAIFVGWMERQGMSTDVDTLDTTDSLWLALDMDSDVNSIDTRETLLALVDQLEPGVKNAIELRFCEDLSPVEIGAQLNVDATDVVNMLQTAQRDLLAKLLARRAR